MCSHQWAGRNQLLWLAHNMWHAEQGKGPSGQRACMQDRARGSPPASFGRHIKGGRTSPALLVLYGADRPGCTMQDQLYPEMKRFILHPCVSGSAQRAGCGDFFASTAILRYESFFTQRKVVVSFTFEVRALIICLRITYKLRCPAAAQSVQVHGF